MELMIKQIYSPFGTEEGIYGLVTEHDEVLYTHYCSSRSYAYGDLYGNRPERQTELKKRFGQVEIYGTN